MPGGGRDRWIATICICAALCIGTAVVGPALAVAGVAALTLAASTAVLARSVRTLRRREAAALTLATEQAAFGRVAAAVAREAAPSELFGLVATEAARALGVTRCLVVRTAGPLQTPTSLDRRSTDQKPQPLHGVPAEPGRAATPVASTDPAPKTLNEARQRAAAIAEIDVHGVRWGTLCVPASAASAGTLRDDADATLQRFADLLARGIANAEERARLLTRACTDALTGLADHRTFHERLSDELDRAARYDQRVSVAIFDIDRFKLINDSVGHLAGDEVLKQVARRIAGVLRGDTLVARLGGDEIAALLPECDALTASVAVERARLAVSEEPIAPAGHVSMSAGLCDNAYAGSAERLLELADGALYWAKEHGRNTCVRYSPDVVSELSAAERADRLARSQAVIGLRALARAIDAKDPATTRHSERVAEVVVELAVARGWPAARVEALREAALVHDVGKLGIQDSILGKPGPLTNAQYEEVKTHTTLGAQIVSDILDPEQVLWVRWHHERPDGRGYPDGLRGEEIPEGARLMALADAWDAMTSERAYSDRMPAAEALAECVRLAGLQFAPEAVQALQVVQAAHATHAAQAIQTALALDVERDLAVQRTILPAA